MEHELNMATRTTVRPRVPAHAPPDKSRKRRWFQYSLRTLLVLMLAFGCGLGWLVMVLRQTREETIAILWIWLVHAAIATVLSAPLVFFGRNRVHWRVWELLVLVLPFLVWHVLMLSPLSAGKSLANLGEPFYFAFAAPGAALVRILVGSRIRERACGAVLIAAVCLVAAGVFFIVPPLPE
jgi:hypothetical protein